MALSAAHGKNIAMPKPHVDLPLRYHTPARWAAAVLERPLELLNDHAHLEKKAASNALELLNRWPEPRPPENWVTAMTAIARDEVDHLAIVCRLLARRGGKLSKSHSNPYATALHALVRKGLGTEELVDRLMISSLIEARSCERFFLLGQACEDAELKKLYENLWASEHGHYLSFIQLAEQILPSDVVAKRWSQMLDSEAEIIQKQAAGPRMHGGMGKQI
jgi:tRNA 2-(methylsulfanyl)-N6-isopentenyladenosine37 hydroxylase